MKITVWLATRDRTTWISIAEVLVLGAVLVAVPSMLVRTIGFALLAHLGYVAMTSLPIGAIPGRPASARRHRRNQDLRSCVVGFLNEIRRVEDFAQRARDGGLPAAEVERHLQAASLRIMSAASGVVKAVGRANPDSNEPETAEVGLLRRLLAYVTGERIARTA